MKRNNLFDGRYIYYLCGSNDVDDVDEVFIIGLLSNNGNSLGRYEHFHMNESNEVNLIEDIEWYCEKNNFDKVFVLKIPSYYMGWIHRDNNIEPFVPLFLSLDNNKTFIIPDLIYGVYNNKDEKYELNINYNPLYDPSGLQYSDEQINRMYKFGCYNLYKNATNRNQYNYDKLKKFDIENRIWERIIAHYSKRKSSKKMLVRFKKCFLKEDL